MCANALTASNQFVGKKKKPASPVLHFQFLIFDLM